jgi:3-oxoacyl-[acyl-carrier-protein] synthase-3
MKETSVIRSSTILGLGAFIPEEVRTNSYWPAEVVQQWGKAGTESKGGSGTSFLHLGADKQGKKKELHPLLAAELGKLIGDPYAGLKERRVSRVLPSEMARIAGEEAIKDANLHPEDIDLFLNFSFPSDRIFPPNVFKIHSHLGLKNARCFEVDVYCNSFLAMIDIAHQYIRGGSAKYVLITTATKYSSFMDYSSSVSVMAGDGGAAAVLGPCPTGKGIRKIVMGTESEFFDTMVVSRRPPLRMGLPETDYGEVQSNERLFFTINDPVKGGELIGRLPYWGEKVKNELFDDHSVSLQDVDVLIPNAATPWYSRILSQIFSIPEEKIEDNILTLCNIGPAILGTNLYTAYKKGRFSEGSTIFLFGHGGGASYGGAILQWHRPS